MATLKHINSKNADYGAAEQYLLFEHDEFTMKPVLDETGRLIPREDYRLSTLNCDGEDFAVACMRANLRYQKNQRREDVKSHHYIISFDPRDGPDNGLTVDRAQALGEQFCKEHFPGHQALVCTHPDGHNHSGNIHVHIVINSLRIEEVPFLPYMDRPADTKVGCKHRCTDAALRYFKSEVMEMCHREGLYQIDLLNGSKNRVTDREYWAQKKGQAALDKQNAPMIADTEHQKEMVQVLSERASRVHSGSVDPSEDNMLKITGDGRKLGLDQRIINQLLPDEPGTKVNQCVGNIMQIWRDGEADKLTQLVFCDISTPQAAPSKKAAKQLDNPTLHALEQAVPLDEPEPAFTIYEDIRQKLIAQGMPAEQIAFIHEAKTEVQKKELFSKVRTGQVRVLLGSTSKMGAGTNVQDRLVALHDLDCPWRPGDLAQRKGRIERQGNQNPLVHVYRYVTEGTFDAYLWQTVENKQKFISQIMTSKSPVRSCDDVDETALSFAEIKALCAGDPRIKERMDLDVEVARLKLMKADHQSKQYRLEDQLLKYFPQEIETNKGFIKGFEADLETLAAHPHPEDGFAGMEIRGDVLTDKENAGAALLDACKEVKGSEPVQIGSYRGFTMSVEFSAWKQEYTLLLKGQMTHRASLGTDPRGNLTRIDNALAQMPQRLEAVKNQLDNLYQQQAAAKEEIGKPFPFEDDLRVKSARLVELDTLLNIDGKGHAQPETVVAKSARPSVLDSLKRPVPPRSPEKKPKQHEEVR